MSQVTIYLNDDLEKKIRKTLKGSKTSLSQWFSSIAEKEVNSQWPQSVAQLSGAWKDFPDLGQIRSSFETDLPREDF